MNIHSIYALIFRWTRRRRMARFEAHLKPDAETRILDIGGTPGNWRYLRFQPRLVLLNISRLHAGAAAEGDKMVFVQGDALAPPAPVAATEFDIVFSNSVIEHVGDYGQQKRFAESWRRLGRRLWVQTPRARFRLSRTT